MQTEKSYPSGQRINTGNPVNFVSGIILFSLGLGFLGLYWFYLSPARQAKTWWVSKYILVHVIYNKYSFRKKLGLRLATI